MTAQNQTQIELWNGRAGDTWVELQDSLDRMLAPVTDALAARVGSVAGKRILDIGCGTGVTCKRWIDGGADVTGVDVSAPMLAAARERAKGRARLMQADASVWQGDAPFDFAVSQFGVMFFDDAEAAFANIAANLRPGGRLVFACWRPHTENPWVTVPMGAVRGLIDLPPVEPHAPGPFGLADAMRTRGVLDQAGFTDITIDPVDFAYVIAGGLEEAVRFMMQIGPTARALAEADKDVKAAAAERLAGALAAYERNGSVTFPGAIWIVEARRT
ncbi:class I SAM-dependent methyltransferase [Terricaulis sp.]|uniref:class I SAM-dependent methyltransferase n=1 Tax=Terricaulis sp. TaxID=2768686 RepID=UPI003784FB74